MIQNQHAMITKYKGATIKSVLVSIFTAFCLVGYSVPVLEDDYYLLSTLEDLEWFATEVNSGNATIQARLTADITMNESVLDSNGKLRVDYASANLYAWNPVGTELVPYKGVFDGNGHTISGMYITRESTVAAFFAYCEGATIQNISFEDSYVNATQGAAILCVQMTDGTITHCSTAGLVVSVNEYVYTAGLVAQLKGESKVTQSHNTANIYSKWIAAGICGVCFTNSSVQIRNCYNEGNVLQKVTEAGGIVAVDMSSSLLIDQCYNIGVMQGWGRLTGGILGFTSNGTLTITNCYNQGTIVGGSGICGDLSSSSTVQYCYNVGRLVGSDSQGAIAYVSDGTVKDCYYYTYGDSYTALGTEADVAEDNVAAITKPFRLCYMLPENFPSDVWNVGSVSGSAISIIDTSFAEIINGTYISLKNTGSPQDYKYLVYNKGTEEEPDWTDDIHFIYTIEDFMAIADNLSGIHYMMLDVMVDENLSNGVLKQNPSVAWTPIGPFSGVLFGNGHTISGVYVNTSEIYAGVFSRVVNGGKVCDFHVSQSSFTTTHVNGSAGALAAYVYESDLVNCSADESVTVSGIDAGGLVGILSAYSSFASISCSYNKATVVATNTAGGIVADMSGPVQVSQTYNSGVVTGTTYAGGIVGDYLFPYTSDAIRDSYNIGTITSPQYAGGICGMGYAIYNCYDGGSVSTTAASYGAITGGFGLASYMPFNYNYYDSTKIAVSAANTTSETGPVGLFKDSLCLSLQEGFDASIWAIREPVIQGNKKILYYPYLQCFGEYSASIGTYRPISEIELIYNGGSCSDSITTYIEREGAVLPSQITQDGYDFVGWYSNMNYSGDAYTSIGTEATGKLTFYAKWTPMLYTITFNTNGGTIASGNIEAYLYGSINILPVDVQKDGYEFSGWYNNENFEGERVSQITQQEYGDKVYYAKWTPRTYAVTLYTSGGTISEGAVTEYTYGTEVELPTEVFLQGYTFRGWYNTSYYDGPKITKIESTEFGAKHYFARWTVDCAVELSASIRNASCYGTQDGEIVVTANEAIEPLTVQWTGLECTSATLSSIPAGNYTVTVTDDRGCKVSETYTVMQPDEMIVEITDVVDPHCDGTGGEIILESNGEYEYSWSNGATTKDLMSASIGDYTVTVTNPETGCHVILAQSLSIAISVPEISLVTVSQSSGKNLVVWVRENTDEIDHYNIYRESSNADIYTKIAEVPYTEISVYEDEDANPMEQSWSYKISATDVCGNETALSDKHSTLHLQKNMGMNGEINLSWGPYVGIDYTSYYVLRETTVNDYTFIDTLTTLPSSLDSYTDLVPSVGTSSYYVAIKLPSVVDPKTFAKAESGPFVIAISNIAEAETTTSLSQLDSSPVRVSVIDNRIIVEGAVGMPIVIYNISGQKVSMCEHAAIEESFNFSFPGVYVVSIEGRTYRVVLR